MNNMLLINMEIDALKNCPFPINQQYKDTLANTFFHFDFYCNGKIIQTDYRQLQNTGNWFTDSSATKSDLSISTDTVNLKTKNQLLVNIPFYAFHNLRKGKQTIELIIHQELFTDQAKKYDRSGSYDYVHVYETKPLINAKIKFDIDFPPVYKTLVYGLGIHLQNDSAWTPAGMDNTIWKSSYPDIYWTIYYPTDKFYAQTPYETSTDTYVAHDTFNLYHYSLNDTIRLGVFDHDDLSRDDVLGYWHGSLKDLTTSEFKRLRFDHIHSFDLKVKNAGIVN